jgi:hypothetical protein
MTSVLAERYEREGGLWRAILRKKGMTLKGTVS